MKRPSFARAFRISAVLACAITAAGCATDTGGAPPPPSAQEFVDNVYLEPFDGGVWIIDGDTPVVSHKQLIEIYNRLYPPEGALIVNQYGDVDSAWTDSQKKALTYCISDSFGARKQEVVTAMADATASWEAVCDVDFHYVSAEDDSCNGSNHAVMFDVRPTQGAPYLARAFFPGQSRSSRNVIIDGTAYNAFISLPGILRHELGHALGFRHEHTRPEAGQCFEDNAWRPLTDYDHASVMHYPQCGGSNYTFDLSPQDIEGARALYGAPGTGEPDPELPVCEHDDSASLAQGEWFHLEPLAVVGGQELHVTISGSGDADLYVRFGSAPGQSGYDCRPYLNHSQESCMLQVPAGASEAYVAVHGYSAASVTISASWQCEQN